MRYTRYNKKNNNNKKIISLITSTIMIIFIAVIVGVVLFKVVFSKLDIGMEEGNVKAISDNVSSNTNSYEFVFIQCGLFSKKENADNVLNQVQTGYNSFVVEEGNEYRVSAGIYTKEEGAKVREALKTKGIETSEMLFEISSSSDCYEQIALMVDGVLTTTNSLRDTEVESVNTETLKKWAKENLDDITEGDGIEEYNDIKNVINNMPETLNKKSSEKVLKEIYTILINYKK